MHWFDKVEMFSFCTPEETAAEHLRLLQWEEEFLQALELPYRVVDIAAGDLGTSAARKYDIEAWFPTQGTYRELTSTSDCGTFQARRLNIRYRDSDGKPQTAATLNGTLCAIARTIACLLEVHQQADGSVHVPAALRPWLGGVDRLTPGDEPGGRGAARMTGRAAEGAQGVRRAGRGRPVVDARRSSGAWRPKLVATDLDGTLLNSAGEVSPRTRAALEACWDAGIPVVGVTGRGPRLLDSVRVALDGRGIAVLAQGGFVVDLERDEVLRTVALPRDQAAAVIERIEAVAGELIVAVEDAAEQGEVHSPLRVQHGFDWPYPEPAHLLPRHEVLPAGAVLKVFLRSSTLGQDELLARAPSGSSTRSTPRSPMPGWGSSRCCRPGSPRRPGWRSRSSATASASATSWCSATCPTTCR